MTPDEELLHIDQVIDRLDARFPDLPRESIEQVVRSAHAHFANGKVRDFVPLLVERLAREKLQGLVPVDPVVPLAAPTAGAEMAGVEMIGAEMIARRRWWSGWLRGWYPDTRMAIVVAAPEPVFPASGRT
ncbi:MULTISPECIES: three-helix bundle dimerization domain-containing protein [unclassified Rhodococcus (in: high G+C Gram-positive bacteria)]|uniref:three-helix bundle dimerization domain-containing protein n=1 Tax=unclassified Rhodococcus (in: high G+C Gram-positive bacteria) TaxID=192944 RepID=UPI00163951A9|nr:MULTISPECIES: hypothetical protein [unclassified Rhodococcus (in: high G+C Gram-positive bacteria)]MBC2638217.1 hypothetical protein [Rhodococcus sp. 3A]MBC2897040.1 hypothetical protein [Rhodococcus sp. 4CII]